MAAEDKERRFIEAEDELGENAIAKAIGDELRRAREKTGLSRAKMVALLPSGIGDRTLLAYEHGLRHLTVDRLVELSENLEVGANVVLGNALQRARIHLRNLPMQVDLRALLAHQNHKFRSLHQWARNKLNHCPEGIVEVAAVAVGEIAQFIGCDHLDLAKHLAQFMPEDSTAEESEESAVSQ